MKITDKVTGWLLIAATTNCEYASVTHILISITQKDIEKWTERSSVAGMCHAQDDQFAYNRYYSYDGQFVNLDDEQYEDLEVVNGDTGKGWAWVELEDGEEDNLPEMELRLDGTESKFYGRGGIQFVAYGKHDGQSEVWSESINVQEIKEAYEVR